MSFSSTFFFFNDTATTEIYTLSLHDALPISASALATHASAATTPYGDRFRLAMFSSPLLRGKTKSIRSEEHTYELQSLTNLVCRLLLEKKKKTKKKTRKTHT